MRAGAPRGILAGHSDDGGQLFAAFDEASRHVEPRVSGSRFSAHLAPYRTADEAARALAEHGAVAVEGAA